MNALRSKVITSGEFKFLFTNKLVSLKHTDDLKVTSHDLLIKIISRNFLITSQSTTKLYKKKINFEFM